MNDKKINIIQVSQLKKKINIYIELVSEIFDASNQKKKNKQNETKQNK